MATISGRARNTVGLMTVGLFFFLAATTIEAQPIAAGVCLLLGVLRALLLARQWRWQRRRIHQQLDDPPD